MMMIMSGESGSVRVRRYRGIREANNGSTGTGSLGSPNFLASLRGFPRVKFAPLSWVYEGTAPVGVLGTPIFETGECRRKSEI